MAAALRMINSTSIFHRCDFKLQFHHSLRSETSPYTESRNEIIIARTGKWSGNQSFFILHHTHGSPWQELPIKAHRLLAKQKILTGIF